MSSSILRTLFGRVACIALGFSFGSYSLSMTRQNCSSSSRYWLHGVLGKAT